MRFLSYILASSSLSLASISLASPYGDHTPWAMLSSQVTCTLTQRNAASGKKPVFDVGCTYKGKETHKVVWDDNFGLLLWEQIFILSVQQDKAKALHSTNLKTLTSSLYPPKSTRKLLPNSTLTSTLDLNKLPASYLSNLFSSVAPTTLVLSIKGDAPPPIPCGPAIPEASWYRVSTPVIFRPN